MITTVGKPVFARLLAGDSSVHLGVGVGSGVVTETPEDCHLAGDGDPLTACHVPLDSGFPHADSGHLVVQATFAPHHAKFDWREFGLICADTPVESHHYLVNTGESPLLLTRKVLLSPLHPEPKGDVHWVFRVRFAVHHVTSA